MTVLETTRGGFGASNRSAKRWGYPGRGMNFLLFGPVSTHCRSLFDAFPIACDVSYQIPGWYGTRGREIDWWGDQGRQREGPREAESDPCVLRRVAGVGRTVGRQARI